MDPGRWRRWAGLATCLLLWPASAWLVWRLDRRALGVAAEAYGDVAIVAANVMPGVVLGLCLVALSRRLLFPLLCVVGLYGLAYVASAKKLEVLGSPLGLQDIYFLASPNRASLELLGSYVERPLLLVLVLAGMVGAMVLAFRFEPARIGRRSPVRWLILAMGVAAALSLYAAAWPWTSVYTKERVRPSALGPTAAVLHSGLGSSMVYRHLRTSNMQFEVDRKALRTALDLLPAGAAAAPAVDGTMPDIVVVLSESFIDPQILQGMASVDDAIPRVRERIDAGKGGMMEVPTYGGGTVRTEFETLTGMPADAFPEAYFPYVDLVRRALPGLPLWLRGQGYETIAIHGNAGSFWNRTNTYLSMGIDRFLTSRVFRERGLPRDGMWYADSGMTDLILEQLDAADKPVFVMAVSMENHGPYAREADEMEVRDPEAWQALQLPAGLHDKSELELRNYLYHLRNADREFGRLVDRLDERGKPYVLAFYGDHLPALADAYSSLGFVDGEAPERQLVPWVVVGNVPGREADDPPQLRHSWQLPAEVLRAAGLSDEGYLRFVTELGRALDDEATTEGDRARLRSGLDAAARAQLQGKFGEYSDAD